MPRAGRTRRRAGGIVVEPHLTCVGCGAARRSARPVRCLRLPGRGRAGQARWRTCSAPTRAPAARTPRCCYSRRRWRAHHRRLGRAARTDASIHGVPARVLPVALWHREHRPRAVAGGHRRRRQPGVGAAQRGGSARIPRGAGRADGGGAGHPAGLGYRGEHFKRIAVRDARSRRARRRAAACGAGRGAAGPLAAQAEKRATLEIALDHLLARRWRPAASRCPGPARRWARWRSTGEVHLCLSCVGACPEARCSTTRTSRSCASSRRTACSAGCARSPPGRRDRLAAAAVAGRRGKARKSARAISPRPSLIAASCAAANLSARCAIEAMMLKLAGPQRLPGRGGEAPEDVRRLPRDRHPQQSERDQDHRPMSEHTSATASRPPTTDEELARAELLRPARAAVDGRARRNAARAVPRRGDAKHRSRAPSSKRPGGRWWRRCARPASMRPPPSTTRCSRAGKPEVFSTAPST